MVLEEVHRGLHRREGLAVLLVGHGLIHAVNDSPCGQVLFDLALGFELLARFKTSALGVVDVGVGMHVLDGAAQNLILLVVINVASWHVGVALKLRDSLVVVAAEALVERLHHLGSFLSGHQLDIFI